MGLGIPWWFIFPAWFVLMLLTWAFMAGCDDPTEDDYEDIP